MQIKVGDMVKAENKLSGSTYDGIQVTEVKNDMIIGRDEHFTEWKLPPRFWTVTVEEGRTPQIL